MFDLLVVGGRRLALCVVIHVDCRYFAGLQSSAGEIRWFNRCVLDWTRCTAFKKGSVVVETEIIPINPAASDYDQQTEVNQLKQTIETPAFAQSFKDEVSSQKTAADDNFPEVDDQTVQVQGVVDTETEGKLKV